MELDLYRTFKNFLHGVDAFWVFTAFSVLIIAFTVVEVILIRNRVVAKPRSLHLSVCLGLVLIETALSFLSGGIVAFPDACCLSLLLLGLSLISYAPISLSTPKHPIIKDEQLNLVKFLDGVAHTQPQKQSSPQPVNTEKCESGLERLKTHPLPQQPKQSIDLDFTHVKNVAERLNYYNLSVTDKRAVTELLSAVAQAENGEFTPELRSKINDYLGMLLKLMSKYNV